MRHTFLTRNSDQPPLVGELIRSSNTASFINIVLEVTPLPDKFDSRVKSWKIRSVRYATVWGKTFMLLGGIRSREIEFTVPNGHWTVVDEFVPADNAATRAATVKSLEGVDTRYAEPTYLDTPRL